jgi:hypothetical protein
MAATSWEVPTHSRTTSRRGSGTLHFLGTGHGTLTLPKCAPVVLSQGEASILLGLSEHHVPPSQRIIFDRRYLLGAKGNLVESSSAPTISLEEQLVGVSATSSFSTQGSYSGQSGRKSSSHLDYVNADDLNNGQDTRTTFMIRRLPRYISAEQLLNLLNRSGYLHDSVDLIYVPVFTGKSHANRGYAFVNFKSPQLGALFMTVVRHSSETELAKQLGRSDIVYAHIQSQKAMIENLTRAPDGIIWQEPTLPPGLLVLN